jgi:hypothetical protein
MWMRFKYEEFSQLVTKNVSPLDYTSVASFEKDYAVVKYLSKYTDLTTGIDLDEVAKSAWEQAEISCAETNNRLRSSRVRGTNRPRVEAVLFTARRKISAALGRIDLAEALDRCRWGPGSTYSLRGEYATLVDKMREYPLNVTHRALPYLKAVVEADPHWASILIAQDVEGPFSLLASCFTTVQGCRATLVAKSAKTKRSIAIEPTGNIFLQLGLGRWLRKRLQRVGVNLDDQSRNQKLAYEGSLSGKLATIDLAAASDTVSRELVFELLPLDLALLLDQIRSPKISWKKNEFRTLEKFSSMGNGFTFELESLIFWGITSAVVEVLETEQLVGVYGDDIICPTECVPLLTEVLSFCGFSVNSEKSHDRGYFRESCGSHYWYGRDVTPVYQKEQLKDLPSLYRACNRLYRYAFASDFGVFAGRRRPWVESSWRATVGGIAEYFGVSKAVSSQNFFSTLAQRGCHVVPFGDESDDGLMLPLRELWAFVLKHDSDGRFQLPVLSFRPRQKTADGRVLLAYWLRFVPETSFEGRIPVRRRGKYLTRRRWFSSFMWVPHPAALDVAW